MEKTLSRAEAQKPAPIGHLRMVFNQSILTEDIVKWPYPGQGTQGDPYIVNWITDDPRNPMNFSELKKWSLTALVALATLAVSFTSSAYSGSIQQMERDLHASSEVLLLGISLFVLGFAIGPLLWAPLSELHGRQLLFVGTYAALTFFNAGAAGSQNVWTLIILRFFAGAFGSSPLTNSGGVIADMFKAAERGLALSLFAAAPFLGPVLGPIVGGFVGETIGWRWNEGIMAIFTGVFWILGALVLPETYPPVLLRKRAAALQRLTGKFYVSKGDAEHGKTSAATAFKTSLSRPWLLLFTEPIVLLLSIYMAIIYGTLYMLFSAFPIVYQENRGWSQGVGGLAFLGVAVGMLLAVAYSVWDNKRYIRVEQSSPSGMAPPEARLPPVLIGGIALPIGLFWFAWTNSPSVHFIVSIIAGAPFGFGMVLVFLGVINYLIDSYVIFAASVLAANAVLRSLFGAIFPLFTTYMFDALFIHWASTIPAFLALICVPFPFLFYKYGFAIRSRCKYAAEAEKFLQELREENAGLKDGDTESGSPRSERSEIIAEAEADVEEREQEAIDYSYEEEPISGNRQPRFERIKTGQSTRESLRRMPSRTSSQYEGNPYDIDRVHSVRSFGTSGSLSRTPSRATSRGTSPSRIAARDQRSARLQHIESVNRVDDFPSKRDVEPGP